jgi:hypothetical protein
MKTRILVIAVALAASVSLSRASIVSQNLAHDGDGVITCSVSELTNNILGYQLNVDGCQHQFTAGHILGDIITDTELDPTLALYQSIENDTDVVWGDYHVQVTMSKSFTFSNVGVANSGWTFTTNAPVQFGTNWIGSIDYYAGTPVLVGGTFDFNYSVSFIGSASFCEQLTPSAVPEPGTTVLVMAGGIFLAGWTVRRRRHG